MSHLGNRLRELRGTHSLYEVEKGTSISRIEISRYEKGKYLPSPQNLEKLAKYFNVTYAELRMLHYEDLFSNPREREIILMWAKHHINKEQPGEQEIVGTEESSQTVSDKELLLQYGFNSQQIIEYPDGSAIIDVDALRKEWMLKVAGQLLEESPKEK